MSKSAATPMYLLKSSQVARHTAAIFHGRTRALSTVLILERYKAKELKFSTLGQRIPQTAFLTDRRSSNESPGLTCKN